MQLTATDRSGKVFGTIEVTPDVKTIGRALQNQLVIQGHGVSRTHASVYLHERGVVICDEGSANGVKVDGQLITGPTLVDQGNRIELSGFSLILSDGSKPAEPPMAAPAPAPAPAPAVARGEDTDEEFDTRLEVHSGAGAALARTKLTLVGRGGPYDGTVIELNEVLCAVGRDADNQVSLEDPSVSRRHAQLRLSAVGDRVTVLDLRSSNGTYVDGEKIKRAEAREGTVIRFGDLAFKLEIKRDTPGAAAKRSPRKRLFVAVGATLVLLIGLGIVAKLYAPKPKVVRQLTPEELLRKRQAQVQALADEARRKIASREWAAAVVQLDEVLKKDPLNAEARRLRTKSVEELSNQKVFERGLKFFALGNKENLQKARKVFEQIPKSSIYARETRYKIKAIDERTAEEYRIDGVSRCKARYWGTCYKLLCKYFEVMPSDVAVPGEPALRRRMSWIEQRYRRSRKFEPCEAPRYKRRPEKTGGDDPAEVLAGKYKVRQILGVVTLYFEGKTDVALKLATKYKGKRAMRPHLRQLEEIIGQLLIIRGKYQEGYSFLRQRNVKEADKNLALVLQADAALIPSKIESFHRREVKRGLSALYADLGAEDFKLKHYLDAFKLWHRGVEIDNSNAKILNGLLALEKEAEKLIRDGKALAGQGRMPDARKKLELARDICRKGGVPRKQAEKALAALGG